ncbi:unnamed protein product [Onchocerca flexuosa]|uniref:DUF3077 domain-containing protein n=1 Tax=Onchocerca flexuosa TaxID=387005 RepID=A0A183HGX3_9BILA|nr:unnamed protein product [Onchocerca flexuosa]
MSVMQDKALITNYTRPTCPDYFTNLTDEARRINYAKSTCPDNFRNVTEASMILSAIAARRILADISKFL